MRLNQITVYVEDILRAKEFYKTLGLQLIVEDDHYCRFVVPGNEATFSIEKSATVNPGLTRIYLECDDLEAKVEDLKTKGVLFETPIEDKPWLWREIFLSDADGNRLCLYHAGKNRLNPPWRIT